MASPQRMESASGLESSVLDMRLVLPPSPSLLLYPGLYPGGLGSASEIINGVTVGAIIAANPIGSPYMPATDCPWAWPYEMDGEFGSKRPPADYTYKEAQDTKLAFLKSAQNQKAQSTVIGTVAVNAALTQKQSCQTPAALAEIGAVAARCVARALMRGIYEASK